MHRHLEALESPQLADCLARGTLDRCGQAALTRWAADSTAVGQLRAQQAAARAAVSAVDHRRSRRTTQQLHSTQQTQPQCWRRWQWLQVGRLHSLQGMRRLGLCGCIKSSDMSGNRYSDMSGYRYAVSHAIIVPASEQM